MEAPAGLLSFLLFLWIMRSGFAGEPCRGFKHLENGRTFFRFKGLYATFTCNPGFRIHGHHTSSCVSGQWVREPPVCVASGCASPGRVQHGSADVNEDGSFVVFSCNDGYRLYGSQLLYCKGKTWSNPKPVCKESDIMSSLKPKPKVVSGSNVEKKLRAPPNLKDYFKSHYNTASKDAYLDSALLVASFPKSHLSGGMLVKPKLAPPQRKPQKKQLFHMSVAAHSELASGVYKNLEVTEQLTRPQQMGITAAAALTTPGPVVLSSTKEPPLPTTTGINFRTFEMNGEVSKPVFVSVPRKADVLLENKSKVAISSPTVSVAKGPPETITVGQSFVGAATSPPTEVSDKFLDTPQTEVSDKFLDTVKTVIPTTSAPQAQGMSAVSVVTTVDIQNEYPKNLDSFTGGVKKMADYVQITTGHPSDHFPDRLERISEPEQLSSSLGDQPHVLPVTESYKDTEEPWTFSEKTERPSQGNEGIAQHEVTSTEKLAFLLQSTPQSVVPSVPTAAFRPTSSLSPSFSEPADSSSSSSRMLQPVRSVLTDPDEEGLGITEEALAVGAKWGFQALVEVLTGATQLEPIQPVTEAADVTPASPLRLNRQQSHMQSSSPCTPTVQIGRVSSYLPEREAFTKARLFELPIKNRRPVCPYPPLPAHGTFYFRTLQKPAPLQYKHYIQYACYPGYSLANGDVYSYCQHNGTWSGTTPVCLEVTPCLLNNGGCSQLCAPGPHHRAQCQCRQGFMLLEDQRTCRDVDECVEERHQCLQACVNTFGSFKCSCRAGFQLGEDGRTCVDASECAEPGRAGCEWKCVNLSGSYHCVCPRGFRRHTDGRRCIDINECNYSNGGCSHICKNLRGGYKCACPPSHHISPSNRKKCLVTA
ncbi:hypothetical protein ACEWY4_016589 [Coilia grayii]|uniref:Uncharacterized protein n=1 Tax=Coilia grayii TaxID=363190 RepID=A0ABD1JKU7_9TELE